MDDELLAQQADDGRSVTPSGVRPVAPNDNLLRLVAASVLTRTGEHYFDSLLRLLSAQFDVALALVGVYEPEAPATIASIVTFQHGRRIENLRYEVHGTPCETLWSAESVCVYPHAVADLFPLDTTLDEVGAQGYVGMPLLDRDGSVMGNMALITASPIEDAETIAATMKVFRRRSALELEHLLAVRRAHESAAQLEDDALDEGFSLADFVRRLDFS